jgi:hypothetical protein
MAGPAVKFSYEQSRRFVLAELPCASETATICWAKVKRALCVVDSRWQNLTAIVAAISNSRCAIGRHWESPNRVRFTGQGGTALGDANLAAARCAMSASGQLATSGSQRVASASAQKAEIAQHRPHVRLVPIADIRGVPRARAGRLAPARLRQLSEAQPV